MQTRFQLYAAMLLLLVLPGFAFAQRPVGMADSSGTVDRQTSAIRNRAVGRGYTAADANRQALNSVRPLQVQNLTGTNFGNSPLRGISAAAGSNINISTPVAARQANRPFSNLQREPTISPYLLLFNDNNNNNDNGFNYQTLVRPMLQQQEFNQQVNRQQQQINMQISELAGKPDYQMQGSEQITPTGHPTTFNNTLNFYPGLSAAARRR